MSRLRRIALAALILLATGVFVFWQLTRVAPAWYEPPDPKNQNVIALADQVEYGLLQQAQKIRPQQEKWSIRLTQVQINSWLSARLPQWLAHRGENWPQQLGTLQVRVEPEGISIALPFIDKGASRTFIARFKPALSDGKLRVEVNHVAMGRITLPGEPLSNLAEALRESAPQLMDDPRIRPLIELLVGQQEIDPTIKLPDDRSVRLVALTLGDGWIDYTAQTIDQ